MNQSEIVQKLDTFFNVHAFNEQDFWMEVIPSGDLAVYEQYATSSFLQGSWNGLMLNNAEEIDRVYLVVLPVQSVLDTILALELERPSPGAMIFCNHAADYEEYGRGFVPLTEAQLEDLREHKISYYCCHAPLDCHPEISTVVALAQAIKLRDWSMFSPHYHGMEGVHGRVSDMTFAKFAENLSTATDLPYINYNQIRFNGQPIEHVAVIPGGGNVPRHLEMARDLGCDTFVSGYWWPSGQHEYAARQRDLLRDLVPTLRMNLLGTSHYASEMPVLRDQMPGWFRSAGIEARFIKQPDPWR